MGKFDQFNYWRKGINLHKNKLKVKPHGGSEYLVYYKILNGEFDESPYWKMVEENRHQFDLEKQDWKLRNKGASNLAFEEWERERRKVWNKQNFKLQEAHHEYELKTLHTLDMELQKTFGFKIPIETFDGSMEELYWKYKHNQNTEKN